ncbi:MAG: ADP-heptose--LPS heptosyltransferase [Fimbriimonadales bacterium]|nr:MAG: ADP-heptose--LPS heptosyltransferase [Fimbriimonadales bacterium]
MIIRHDDKLGETLLATPVFQAIKQAVPEVKVEAWLGNRWAHAVSASPWLDAVRGVPYRPRVVSYWRWASTIRQLRPEALLILRPDTLSYALISCLAGAKVRVGAVVARRSVARLLTHVAALNPSVHQVEKNLAVAEAWLGQPLPRHPLHYAPRDKAHLPPAIEQLSGRYAILHLSTGGVQPQWRPERFAAVGSYLMERYSLVPILTGSADAQQAGESCATALTPAAINLVGQTSILELAEVIRRATLVVSVDTGIVHLAAALRTPCVSLHFRRDYPVENWYAWQTPTVSVSPPTYCAGCTRKACRRREFICVQSLHSEQVVAAIDALFAQTPFEPSHASK